MSRSMSPAEKIRFQGYFPALNVNQAVVTDNATRTYNCISWTVGVTTAWLWPGATLAAFDALYARYGLRRAANGPIAAWGISTTQMIHGCVSGPSHGPRWESKCGADLRIQHGLNELVGASYGRVLAFYAPSSRFSNSAAAARRTTMKPSTKPRLTPAQAKILASRVKEVSTTTRKKFEDRFMAWKETWFAPPLAISSDPSSRTHSAEFHDLVALGPEILPLVVEKLTDPDNFLALNLYDAIQPQQNLIVQFDAEDDRIIRGEQGRAEAVVNAYLGAS